MTLKIGIDIGGTFTDFVLFDSDNSSLLIEKVLTTPTNPSVGVLQGTAAILGKAKVSLSDISLAIHGTTLVANTIIERTGVKTGLLTTKGWRDTLEIGMLLRYDLYDLFLEFPPPLVPRFLRKEVTERVRQDGTVLVELDTSEVRSVAKELRSDGVEAVAVVLIHSYQNSSHERSIRDILTSEFPELSVTLSSEIAPEIRETERSSTTVANAYVQPVVEKYLTTLESGLKEAGLLGDVYMMLSSGGTTTVSVAQKFPIRLIESGPAGGAIAASFFGEIVGLRDLISFDMGGTTAKMCVIEDGEPTHSNECEAARMQRFKKGSGLLLRVPVIEMIEIGAGGGSIAHIDSMGLLKVGPSSSGASPGPACYNRGGNQPTVTDADLLLGYLDPDFFLGGEMKLSRAAAETAVQTALASPLNLTVEQAAAGIFGIVNENMASATRVYAAERGVDPRRSVLFAFGGAGPVHACALARLLRIRQVICPRAAGALSALGFLVAPLRFDFARSYVARLDGLDFEMVNSHYDEMESSGRRMLQSAGVPHDEIRFSRTAEMRYVGQGFEVEVTVPSGTLSASSLSAIGGAFGRTYENLFGRSLPGLPIEALTWRVVASGPRPSLKLNQNNPPAGHAGARKGDRPAYDPESQRMVTHAVYDRYTLTPGSRLAGPAIIEERESTTVVGPATDVRVDDFLNLVVDFHA